MRNIVSNLTQISKPAFLPVDLSDIKRHVGVTDDAHDVELEMMAWAAVSDLVAAAKISLTESTYSVTLSSFPYPCGMIELWYPPIRTVDISYVDEDGNTQTLDPTGYYMVGGTDTPAELHPAVGTNWPEVQAWNFAAVTITYGVGAMNIENVPEAAQQYIYVNVRDRFDNPDGYRSPEVAEGLQRLADPLRVFSRANSGFTP